MAHQRPYHRYVYPHIPQLLQAHVVLNNGDDIPPDTMDIGVDRQVRMGVRDAGEDGLGVDFMADVPSKQRSSLGLLNLKMPLTSGVGTATLSLTTIPTFLT